MLDNICNSKITIKAGQKLRFLFTIFSLCDKLCIIKDKL